MNNICSTICGYGICTSSSCCSGCGTSSSCGSSCFSFRYTI